MAVAAVDVAPGEQGCLVGLAYVGRSVSDLDRSIEFYEALGFKRDPAVSAVWHGDEGFLRAAGIGSAQGVTVRRAELSVDQPAGGRFVLHLREWKGLRQRNLSDHAAWNPGVSHFAFVVPDAQVLWTQLQQKGLLRSRSWGGQLVAPPGQTRGLMAYITDPDGMDVEIIEQRLAAVATDGRPARAAFIPGVNHVGLVVLDSVRARAFYGDLLGGRLMGPESPWMQGDFFDAPIGGRGNVLRFCNEAYPAAFEARLDRGADPALVCAAPGTNIHIELIEFQNRKQPVAPASLTDIGVGAVGFEVRGIEAFLARVGAGGAVVVSEGGGAVREDGARVAVIRDPDVGGFIELRERLY